jgi:hypothetical protein
MRKRCNTCGSAMTRFENPDRWVCTNIKAHAKAQQKGLVKRRGKVRNPDGINQPLKRIKCPRCHNGRNRPGCIICNSKGWIMGRD